MKESFNDITGQLRDLLRQTLAVEEALLRILEKTEASGSAGTDMLQEGAEADVLRGGAQSAGLPQTEEMTLSVSTSPETSKDTEKDDPDASSEAAAEVLLDMAKKNGAMAEASRGKAEELLKQIQYATEDGRDTSSLESDVLLLEATEEDIWRERIVDAKKRGMNARREREYLATILKHGVCSDGMARYWRELPARSGWFRHKAAKQIAWKLGKELEREYKTVGLEKAEAMLRQARKLYGSAVEQVAIPEAWRRSKISSKLPSMVRNTEHTLSSRKPVQQWDVYIDETGLRFSEEESGTEGRVVAVCVRQGSYLPDLGHFHCTEAAASDVLRHCNTLLQSDCGILGFTRSALDIKSQEGWLQAIRELVKWIWRLLPTQTKEAPVGLRFHVEQRSQYSAELPTALGEKMLVAELTREN
ncbi:MAG: hypothetical protein IJT83_09820, partial [Victivallales bacterium]|nr:hypothetical protein [Victivallales bacterium]